MEKDFNGNQDHFLLNMVKPQAHSPEESYEKKHICKSKGKYQYNFYTKTETSML